MRVKLVVFHGKKVLEFSEGFKMKWGIQYPLNLVIEDIKLEQIIERTRFWMFWSSTKNSARLKLCSVLQI